MAAALKLAQQEVLPLCRQTSPLSKDSKNSTLERDAGFCSGGDEEYLEADDELQAPTDTSDDSVEVKAPAAGKNKRKSAEPRKVAGDDASPYKKRKHLFGGGGEDARVPVPPLSDYSTASDTPPHNPRASLSPFRPWSNPATTLPPYTDRVPAIPQQDEPLSLVLRHAGRDDGDEPPSRRPRGRLPDDPGDRIMLGPAPPSLSLHARPRPAPSETCTSASLAAGGGGGPRPKFSVESLLGGGRAPPDDPQHRPPGCSTPSTSSQAGELQARARPAHPHPHSQQQQQQQQQQQRNYKNMTRERRIEANARERTRVHTISAAFDTLRRAIPSYSHNQKLSKLSVLRIACSYILTLSRVAGLDYSGDQSEPSLASCVEQVTRTIHTEGKLRRKKDD